MNLLNPYFLLGVNTNSTLRELKKQYYNLALLCHPDKGGNKDDMCVIKNAYEYIKPQLENNHNKTFEELEKDFEDFCKIQDESIGPFSQIYEESHDWIKEFNKEFENKKITDILKPGYGHLMDKSELKFSKYSDEINKKNINNFSKELITYQEPHYNPIDFGNLYRFDVKEINDFSDCNILNMNDYYHAFSEPEDLNKFIDNKIEIDIDKEFKNRQKQYN